MSHPLLRVSTAIGLCSVIIPMSAVGGQRLAVSAPYDAAARTAVVVVARPFIRETQSDVAVDSMIGVYEIHVVDGVGRRVATVPRFVGVTTDSMQGNAHGSHAGIGAVVGAVVGFSAVYIQQSRNPKTNAGFAIPFVLVTGLIGGAVIGAVIGKVF